MNKADTDSYPCRVYIKLKIELILIHISEYRISKVQIILYSDVAITEEMATPCERISISFKINLDLSSPLSYFITCVPWGSDLTLLSLLFIHPYVHSSATIVFTGANIWK